MKNKLTKIIVALLASFAATSCSVVEGIFKTGFGIGIFVSILVVVALIYIIRKFLKK